MKDNVVPQQTAKEEQKTQVFFGFFKCDRLCNDYFLHKSTHYTVFQCFLSHLPASLVHFFLRSHSLSQSPKNGRKKKISK